MNYDEVKDKEGKPVKLFLKTNSAFFYGIYTVINTNTISFTDRKKENFPIDIDFIGMIQPVDKINYIGENNG